jgi:hypothetical protein
LNRQILIAIIVIVAISALGTVVYNILLANDSTPRGSILFQSDVAGVAVTLLGPDETLRYDVIGTNGMLTLSALPNGDYQGIATKKGYNPSQLMGTSIKNGGSTTIPIFMTAIPSEQSLYAASNPSAVVIKQGSSGAITVTVTSPNDYESVVSLNCYQLPSWVTATFDSPSFTLAAGGDASSILTLNVSSTATKGIYPVNIEMKNEHERSSDSILWLGFLLQVS